MASILNAPHFHDEQAAYDFVEARVWPHGSVCPHCGTVGEAKKLNGKSTRIGTWKCYTCRKPFTVKIGTIFEDSHIKMHIWLQAIFLLCSSKKGISSNQLHRTLGVTLKTAWFLSHRIREAMSEAKVIPFGGPGAIVEVDETFIGWDKTKKPRWNKYSRGYAHKYKVLALVDRKSGRARSIVVDDLKMRTIIPLLKQYIAADTHIMTDEAGQYTFLRNHFGGHGVVRHSAGEYGLGETHTNTIEGFFSIFKRGMKGIYQHCSREHLHRYLAEFDFRYNERQQTDSERSETALRGIAGKRLMYRDSCSGKGRIL